MPSRTRRVEPAKGELGCYFEYTFRPSHLADSSQSTVRRYRATLRQFERFHNRPVKLADLMPDRVRDFKAWLLTFGHFRSDIDANWKESNLWTLGRYVHPDLFSKPRRFFPSNTRSELLLALPERSILRYLLESYLPSRDCSPADVMAATQWVREFEGWSGGATMDDLSDDLVSRYADQLERTGQDAPLVARKRKLLLSMRGAAPRRSTKVAAPLWLVLDKFKQRRKRMSGESWRKYEIALRHLEKFLGRTATVRDLRTGKMEDWLTWLVAERAPATANDYCDRICRLWKFAANHRMTKQFPEVERLKEPKRRPRALSHRQVAALLRAAANSREMIGANRASQWWTALILVLFDTGWRIGATLSLRWEDLDLATGMAEVRAEHQKHGADDIKRLHPDTLAAIGKLDRSSDLVLPWPTYITTLYNRWKRLRVRAGIPAGREYGFHSFRRTMATNVASVAGDAMASDFAQHSSVAVTRRHYIDPTNDTRKHPVDIVGHPWTDQRKGGAA